jgi:hypothetical protein
MFYYIFLFILEKLPSMVDIVSPNHICPHQAFTLDDNLNNFTKD